MLALSACGGEEEPETTPEPTEEVLTPEPTATPEPTVAADAGCSADYPRRLETSDPFEGFVIACSDLLSGHTMTIENTSDTAVFGARPVDQGWSSSSVTVVDKDEPVVQLFPLECDRDSCPLPPGTILTITALEPIRADLETRQAETLGANVAYSGLQLLEDRVGSPGQQLLDKAADCAAAVGTLGVSEGGYLEQFRSALGLRDCHSLYRSLSEASADPNLQQPRSWTQKAYQRAEQLLGASFDDVMTLLMRIAPH